MTDNFEKDINVPSKRPPYEIALMHDHILRLEEALKAKEQELEEFRGVIRKDICSHYVLGECSQKHHNNCVGRNQCIKDLEQECEELKAKCKKYGEINEQETKDYAELKAERDSYIDKYFLESQKVLKLNKVLKEIKELCQKHIKAEKIVMANDILQKISEVIDE